MTRFLTALALMGSLVLAGTAAAETHQVQMLTKSPAGEMNVFEPPFLKVQPGDTVTFVPTEKGHNSETIKDAIPEGAEGWKGKINQEVSVSLTEPGLYVYKCLPHLPLGMVGLIQVGDEAPNRDAVAAAAAKLPGKAKERMAAYLEEAGPGDAAAAEPAAGVGDTAAAQQ